jgi:PST family polysaccharide transporter
MPLVERAGARSSGPHTGCIDPVHESPDSGYGRGTITLNALWRVLDSGGSELLSILFFVVLGRLLTPADFGVVAIAGVFLLSGQLILRSGFGIAIIQRDRLEPAHLDAAFWTNLALGMLLALLLIAVSSPVATALGEPMIMHVMVALAPTLLLSCTAWIFHARLKREMRYDVVFFSAFASIMGGGLVGLFLALAGAGVWSLVGQQVSGAVFSLMVLVLRSSWRPGLRLSRRHVRDLASFSLKVMAGHALDTASQRTIPLILAFFLSVHTVGLYVIASRLMWALANLTMYVIWDLSLVVLSRLRSQPERHREGAYYTLRITSLVCLPLFVGAALIADPLIPLLLGANWAGSIPVFQMLCFFSIFYALYSCTRQILISAGHAGPALRLAVMGGIMVPTFAVAAAPLGVAAAAAAVGIASVIALSIAVWWLQLELGISVGRLIRDQAPTWIAAAVMALTLTLFPLANIDTALPPTALVSIKIVCATATFVLLVLLLAPDYIREVGSTLYFAIRTGGRAIAYQDERRD